MKILIRNLEIPTLIGVYESERQKKQRIIYNFEIETKICYESIDDNIENVLDYDDICNKVKKIVANTEFKLLESLIKTLQQDFFASFMQIQSLKIRLGKPNIVDNCEIIEIEEEFCR